MTVQVSRFTTQTLRISSWREGCEVGHAYLYIMTNDLHDAPFGLVEDVFVEDQYRNQGVGHELMIKLMSLSKQAGVYKLIATSRDDGTRQSVHDWYERLGFKKYGVEFRIDIK